MSGLNDEFLADYASGTLSPGMSLLAAAHLTLCAAARARVEAFETLGGAFLEGGWAEEGRPGAAALPPPSLDRALAMLDAETLPMPPALAAPGAQAAAGVVAEARPDLAEAAAAAQDEAARDAPGAAPASVMPTVLRAALGADEGDAPWSFRLPGLSEAVFDGFEGEEVSLIRARPGAPIFSHTHEGVEATLILCGAMEDGGRVYRRGDVNIATPEVDHRPRILDEGQCICFVVNSGKLRFTGPFSRALNLFAE